MPVIHECAPASPAAKKWHMANPPGVQLHACKCHNLKAATHFFWEAKKNTPVSRIDGLVASGVIGHFFRYMDIMHTHQNCQKCKENNSSFQAISRASGTVLVRIHLPAGHPSPRRWRIHQTFCRFHDSLHSGGEVVFCHFLLLQAARILVPTMLWPFRRRVVEHYNLAASVKAFRILLKGKWRIRCNIANF